VTRAKRRGGYRQVRTNISCHGKEYQTVRTVSDPYLRRLGSSYLYSKDRMLTESDKRFFDGSPEDAFKVQFETSDLKRVLEGV
jgi:hypothetical protein